MGYSNKGILTNDQYAKFLSLLDDHTFFSTLCPDYSCVLGTVSDSIYYIEYFSNTTTIDYAIDQGYIDKYIDCNSTFIEKITKFNSEICGPSPMFK